MFFDCRIFPPVTIFHDFVPYQVWIGPIQFFLFSQNMFFYLSKVIHDAIFHQVVLQIFDFPTFVAIILIFPTVRLKGLMVPLLLPCCVLLWDLVQEFLFELIFDLFGYWLGLIHSIQAQFSSLSFQKAEFNLETEL